MQKKSIVDVAKEKVEENLKNGAVIDIEGVDEIPETAKIFAQEHIDYIDALTGQLLLNGLKGQLLNIIEGIGLPVKQETAVKRMVTNCLHDIHHDISEDLELVRGSEDGIYFGPGRILMSGDSELANLINEYMNKNKTD